MQQLKYALAGLLFLSPAIAFADDPPATTEGSTEAGASADASAGGAGASASAEVGTTGGEATAAAGATVVGEGMINESYLAAKSKLVLFGGFDFVNLSISDGMGNSASANGEFLRLGAGYGVTDKITAGAVYAPPIAGDLSTDRVGKGPLALYGEFELVHNDKLNVAASADFTYDLCGSADQDGCVGTKAIHAGLGARYLVAPKVAIFTGAPIGPGPVGQHLSISLEDKGPINFDVPIGVGLQATPQIFAYLETNLLTFRISNKPDGVDSVSVLGSDIEKGGIGIPLQLGGFFSVSPQLDVGAHLAFVDLGHAGDFYSVGADVRFKL